MTCGTSVREAEAYAGLAHFLFLSGDRDTLQQVTWKRPTFLPWVLLKT